jgi:ribokinase
VTRRAPTRKTPALVVFGEFFLDLVFYDLPSLPALGEEVKTRRYAEFPGGGLATTALVAAGLGTPTAVITKVGQDAPSSPAWQKLVGSGVSVESCEFHPCLPTARTVCAAYNGDRMLITHDAINQRLQTLLMRRTVRRELRNAKHVHLACTLWPLRLWTSAIRKLGKQKLTVSADIGWNPAVLQSPQLPTLLRELDFVFPNEIEARAMTGATAVENAAKKLAQWVRVPVVKLGRDGCIAVQDGRVIRARSLRVRAVDATGAGDAFNGGFLHAYLSGLPLEECMRAGNVCGALATTRAGGSSAIPTRKKLAELMETLR